MFKVRILLYWIKIKLFRRFTSRTRLEHHQQVQLANFTRCTLTRSAFYESLISNNKLDVTKVPIMTKQAFMDNFDAINTVGLTLKSAMDIAIGAEFSRNFSSDIDGITVGLSTGTSGQRGIFLASEKERAIWTSLVMSKVIKPRLLRKQKIAFFLRANSNLYSSVASSLFEFRYFDIFQPIELLLEQITSYQPDIVAAQPSILIEIAKACAKGHINIGPHQIISFAEVLHDSDRRYIQKHIKAPITEVYQCTEGFLGVSCQHGTIHINEEFMIMEKAPIDSLRFNPIITDFTRTTQPVVRYKLDDVLVSRSTPCPCGSVLMGIERIEGRDDDVLVFGDKRLYPDLLARRIAVSSEQFFRYQIIQSTENLLSVHIDVSEEQKEMLEQLMKNTILQLLNEQNINGINIQFMGNVLHTQGTKFRKIKKQIQ